MAHYCKKCGLAYGATNKKFEKYIKKEHKKYCQEVIKND